MILIIDNYDSFTYNLYQYIGEINPDILVCRNDKLTIEEIEEMGISHIIISPGPGFPKDAGICEDVIRHFAGKIPLLGVCLGHQAIGEVYGGRIVHAKETVHGKTSMVSHTGTDLFQGVENPVEVMRYHSLVVERESLSPELEITAQDESGQIMALRHKRHHVYGVQFHPESIGTHSGKQMLRNFLSIEG